MEQKKPLPMQLMCVCQGHFSFSHVHEAMAMSAAHVHSKLTQLEEEGAVCVALYAFDSGYLECINVYTIKEVYEI